MVTGGPYSGVIKKFIDRLRRGKRPIIYGDGEQTRDFVYVKDVVGASMLVLGCQHCAGEVINIGTGKPTTINELAKVLMRTFGESGVKPEYVTLRAGDIRNSYADINEADRMLGYWPKVVLKEGIRKLLCGQKGIE